MPNFRQRKWFFISIAIAMIVILTLVAAPNNSGGSKSDSGSTYSRTPAGYGAWYQYMEKQEIPIRRWRKPFAKLIQSDVNDVTYIQVLSKNNYLLSGVSLNSSTQSNWVSKGNTLVIVGKYEPATAAPFSSLIPYRQSTLSSDKIKIETTRRYRQSQSSQTEEQKSIVSSILKDRYGAVVWQEKIGKGKIIYCATPYLAANAYQQNPDNYQFLADLVDDRQAIWVDEYIHGYKDEETIAREKENQPETLFSYLAKTPWFLLFIQTVLVIIIAAITTFRRFGMPIKPKTAIADNSIAYVDALAGVLEKASSTDFVVEAIAKDEQRQLQQSLGLGKSLIDQKSLIAAYKLQKGESAADLSELFRVSNAKQKISDAQLITWIQKWQEINQDVQKKL
ncbi:MAG: DUF4350 domain-containing protein [Cyanobacteria bacterium J06600_6]